MLRSLAALKGYKVRATDKDCGHIDHFLFDDRNWKLTYVVIETGHWYASHKVLVEPQRILREDWLTEHIYVSMDHDEVIHCPDVNSHPSVSLQHETEAYAYYRWPYLWLSEGLWEPRPFLASPLEYINFDLDSREASAPEKEEFFGDLGGRRQPEESHLRSTGEVTGYHLQALDKEFGHVEDFIIDDAEWNVRYLIAATKNFWPGGKSILLSPQWITQINWSESKVSVDLHAETIKNGPEFNPYASVNREYEVRLYDYYGRPKYWDASVRRQHESAPEARF